MRFSLKSFTGRSGFALSRAARAAVLALLFAALLAAAFNACGYTTRSDSAMYFGQMLKLKADYFQRNLAALRYDGPPADAPRHVTLGTEGGYAFLLRAAEAALGLRAMYHVNSVLMPLMIAALAWCAHIVAGGGVRGRLAAVLLVCLLSTPYVSRREALFLADLLRDPPSHLLGFLSLGAVLLLPGAGRRAGPLAAGMGFAIGLSAWFRLTGLMFALPIGLYILAGVALPWRRRIAVGAWLGLGIALGLTPLLAQNALEGKRIHETGQIEALAGWARDAGADKGAAAAVTDGEEDDAPDETDGEAGDEAGEAPEGKDPELAAYVERLSDARSVDQRPEGFHPMYFRLWFPRLARRVFTAFGTYCAVAALFFAAFGLLTAGRRALLFLGAALLFAVFYSFYDKILWRYLYLSTMLVAVPTAVGLASAADAAIGFVRARRARVALSALVVCAAALPALEKLRDEGEGVFGLSARWRKMEEARREMEESFRPDDLFVTYDQNLRRWIEFMAQSDDAVTRWGIKAKRDSRKRIFDELLASDERRVLFLGRLRDGEREQPSWWKDDLLNEYDLEPMGPRFRNKFICHRVRPRAALRREVPLASYGPTDGRLFMFARKLSITNRWQSVRIAAADGTNAVTALIQAGPNLLPLPAGLDPARPAVTLFSDAPLPSFVAAETVGARPARMPWCSYEHMPSLRFASDESLNTRWFGYKRWKRDWGGYDRKHMSYPLWQLPPGSSLRLPAHEGDMGVRLYFSAYRLGEFSSEAETALPPALRQVRYRVNGTELAPRLVLMRPLQKRRAWKAVDYAHDLRIPSEALGGAAGPNLQILYGGPYDWDILLYQMEFFTDNLVASGDDAAPDPDANAYAWREEADESVWGLGGWLDPALRALDGPVSIPLSVPTAEAPAGAVLVVYWPDRAEAKARLTYEAGGATGVLTLRTSSRPVPHYVALKDPAADTIRLTPEYGAPPACVPVVNFILPVRPVAPDRPLTVGAADEAAFALLSEGFWWPETQADGSVMRWTGAAAAMTFPLARADRDLALTVVLQGPPRKAGVLPLKALLNGAEVGETEVAPEVKREAVFRLPAAALREGLNRIELRTRGWRPSDLGKSEDSRELGLYVRSITLSVAEE